jgi:hypothetical protein
VVNRDHIVVEVTNPAPLAGQDFLQGSLEEKGEDWGRNAIFHSPEASKFEAGFSFHFFGFSAAIQRRFSWLGLRCARQKIGHGLGFYTHLWHSRAP